MPFQVDVIFCLQLKTDRNINSISSWFCNATEAPESTNINHKKCEENKKMLNLQKKNIHISNFSH